MNILFHFIHPSKFHLFRNTINELISSGHTVDVTIIKKDVMEDLVREEKWNYTNIFPEGRKIKGIPIYLGAGINLIRTIYRLWRYTRKKKYDLFITDDLLGVIGRYKNIPTIHFTDDHLSAIPEQFILFEFCDYIIAPECVDLGRYKRKLIPIKGLKQSAYLHPNQFIPDNQIIKTLNLEGKRYFIIRLVSLKATHDVGKKGISDDHLSKIIELLDTYGDVRIVSEREVHPSFNKYRIDINSREILNVLYYADLFVGDSQTMAAEAGYLGTPFIWYSHFHNKVCYLDALINKYHLGFGVELNNFDELLKYAEEIVSNPGYKKENLIRREVLINETIDLTEFLLQKIKTFIN